MSLESHVADKTDTYHADARRNHQAHHTQEAMKHGDRALKFIGDERVELTHEDVSWPTLLHGDLDTR
jgi:hypothetical protein